MLFIQHIHWNASIPTVRRAISWRNDRRQERMRPESLWFSEVLLIFKAMDGKESTPESWIGSNQWDRRCKLASNRFLRITYPDWLRIVSRAIPVHPKLASFRNFFSNWASNPDGMTLLRVLSYVKDHFLTPAPSSIRFDCWGWALQSPTPQFMAISSQLLAVLETANTRVPGAQSRFYQDTPT